MQVSSKYSPTSLSNSLAAVLGAEHSTLFLAQSASNLTLASSVSNSVGFGNFSPKAFSKSGNILNFLKGGVKSKVHSGPSGPSG